MPAPRAVSRWAAPQDRARAARLYALLLIALRGNIFLWEGGELGLPQAEIPFAALKDPEAIANWPLTLGRDGTRTPMPWRSDAPNGGFSSVAPWLPVPEAHRALAVDLQEADPDSQLHMVRRLQALRRDSAALRLGASSVERPGEDLLIIHRHHDGTHLTCAYNLGLKPHNWSGHGSILAAVNGATASQLPPLSGIILQV